MWITFTGLSYSLMHTVLALIDKYNTNELDCTSNINKLKEIKRTLVQSNNYYYLPEQLWCELSAYLEFDLTDPTKKPSYLSGRLSENNILSIIHSQNTEERTYDEFGVLCIIATYTEEPSGTCNNDALQRVGLNPTSFYAEYYAANTFMAETNPEVATENAPVEASLCDASNNDDTELPIVTQKLEINSKLLPIKNKERCTPLMAILKKHSKALDFIDKLCTDNICTTVLKNYDLKLIESANKTQLFAIDDSFENNPDPEGYVKIKHTSEYKLYADVVDYINPELTATNNFTGNLADFARILLNACSATIQSTLKNNCSGEKLPKIKLSEVAEKYDTDNISLWWRYTSDELVEVYPKSITTNKILGKEYVNEHALCKQISVVINEFLNYFANEDSLILLLSTILLQGYGKSIFYWKNRSNELLFDRAYLLKNLLYSIINYTLSRSEHNKIVLTMLDNKLPDSLVEKLADEKRWSSLHELLGIPEVTLNNNNVVEVDGNIPFMGMSSEQTFLINKLGEGCFRDDQHIALMFDVVHTIITNIFGHHFSNIINRSVFFINQLLHSWYVSKVLPNTKLITNVGTSWPHIEIPMSYKRKTALAYLPTDSISSNLSVSSCTSTFTKLQTYIKRNVCSLIYASSEITNSGITSKYTPAKNRLNIVVENDFQREYVYHYRLANKSIKGTSIRDLDKIIKLGIAEAYTKISASDQYFFRFMALAVEDEAFTSNTLLHELASRFVYSSKSFLLDSYDGSISSLVDGAHTIKGNKEKVIEYLTAKKSSLSESDAISNCYLTSKIGPRTYPRNRNTILIDNSPANYMTYYTNRSASEGSIISPATHLSYLRGSTPKVGYPIKQYKSLLKFIGSDENPLETVLVGDSKEAVSSSKISFRKHMLSNISKTSWTNFIELTKLTKSFAAKETYGLSIGACSLNSETYLELGLTPFSVQGNSRTMKELYIYLLSSIGVWEFLEDNTSRDILLEKDIVSEEVSAGFYTGKVEFNKQAILQDIDSLRKRKDAFEKEKRKFARNLSIKKALFRKAINARKGDSSLISELNNLCDKGSIEGLRWVKDVLYIRTSAINIQANLNKPIGNVLVLFGRYIIRLGNINGNSGSGLQVNFVNIDNYKNHPHVRQTSPCLGNVSAMLQDRLEQQDLVSIVNMLLTYLASVNVEDVWGKTVHEYPRVHPTIENYIRFGLSRSLTEYTTLYIPVAYYDVKNDTDITTIPTTLGSIISPSVLRKLLDDAINAKVAILNGSFEKEVELLEEVTTDNGPKCKTWTTSRTYDQMLLDANRVISILNTYCTKLIKSKEVLEIRKLYEFRDIEEPSKKTTPAEWSGISTYTYNTTSAELIRTYIIDNSTEGNPHATTATLNY